MRKGLCMLMTLMCLLVFSCSALAAGTTVTTFTPFADMDFAAQGYMDIVTAWEEETGNIVEDYSGLQDDLFLQQMTDMVSGGKADIVVVPVGSGLTGKQLVSVDELLAAAPDCGARKMTAMAESDGSILLTPVRLNWEALYVNTDVLEQNGLSVPTNYEELVTVCAVLAQKGVTPIANALCEWSEIALDCAAMIGAPENQYGQQPSLDGAKSVLTALTKVGAFGVDPWNLTDEDAKNTFLEGVAAMRFDGSDLAELIGEARQENVAVVSLSGMDGTAAHQTGRHAELWSGDHPRLLAGQHAPRRGSLSGYAPADRKRRGGFGVARVHDKAGAEHCADDRIRIGLRRAALRPESRQL